MKGYIYKITNADESIVYVGSTTQTLQSRWWGHKSDYNKWVSGKHRPCSIYEHFLEHGIDEFSIHLVSEHDIGDRKQLCEFEQLVIDSTPCVNKARAFASEQQKEETRLRYEELHREKNNAYCRQYHEVNKEAIAEQRRQYRIKNKNRINENNRKKILCECGVSVSNRNMSAHRRSAKHQQWLADDQ